jgi:hypothetical protein
VRTPAEGFPREEADGRESVWLSAVALGACREPEERVLVEKDVAVVVGELPHERALADNELDGSTGLEQLLDREQVGGETGHVEGVLEDDEASACC